jgi:hypothetical protein
VEVEYGSNAVLVAADCCADRSARRAVRGRSAIGSPIGSDLSTERFGGEMETVLKELKSSRALHPMKYLPR